MASPTPVTRVAPGGVKLSDGRVTKIAFQLDPDVSLYEISIKPGSMDGGDAIEQTTMWNEKRKTWAPQGLYSSGEHTGKFAYDPECRGQLDLMINEPQAITEEYPDGSKYTFWGYLKSADFDELATGTRPEVSVTIVQTDTDPSDNSEADPVFTPAPGT